MGPLRRTGMVFAAAVLLALIPRLQADAAETHYVSPDGNDSASGTESSPWASFSHALSQLEPGDVLVARGGTYEEEVRNPDLASGTRNSPITVRAHPGERPVIEGLLWLDDPDYWRFDGINVTWGNGDSGEHMVKLNDGTGWEYVNSEIWGAESYAGVLVYSSGGSEPNDWRIAGNCIHDTEFVNGINNDHLIYANSGHEGSGVIEGNLLYNAVGGNGVKLGGPDPDVEGTSNVAVRYNTVVNTHQSLFAAWEANDNLLERNLLYGVSDNYSNIRAYQVTGSGNRAVDNLGGGSDGMFRNDDGYTGWSDAGGNVAGVNPSFDSTSDCDGFNPTNPEARGYGHTAAPDYGIGGPGSGGSGGGSGSGRGDGSGGSASDDPVDGTFADDDGNVFEDEIEQIADAGITAGCNPPDNDRYCPDRRVTRGQMAAFLTRTLDLDGGGDDDRFRDDDGSIFQRDIDRLAAAGITVGCNPPEGDRYCPQRPVTRAQMASFLARAAELDGESDRFQDTGRSAHAGDIGAIAAAGITKGCNPPDNDRYCPARTVTRGQMAAFIVRAFDP